MGLDMMIIWWKNDKEWMEMYKAIWKKQKLEVVVRKDAYISPKLITWRGQFKTNFNGEIFLLVAVLKRRLF